MPEDVVFVWIGKGRGVEGEKNYYQANYAWNLWLEYGNKRNRGVDDVFVFLKYQRWFFFSPALFANLLSLLFSDIYVRFNL